MGFLFSLVVYVLLFLLAVSLNLVTGMFHLDNVAYFFDPVALVFVVVSAVGFTLAAAPAGALQLGIAGAFNPSRVGRDGPAALEALRFLGDMSLLMGVVGTLIGVVLMLHRAGDARSLGLALAAAMLAYVYGFTLRLLCRAGARRIAAHLQLHR